MKKLFVFVGVLVIAVLGVAGVLIWTTTHNGLGTSQDIPQEEVSVGELPQPIELCYWYEGNQKNTFPDRALLRMTITGPGGSQVVGEYRNLPGEKDSKTGPFSGTIGPMDPATSSRTADVWWDSLAEGMRVTEQLRIVFGEGSAAAQFGEMVDAGDSDRYVYKDTAQLTSGFQMSQVDCEVFDDRIIVEDYLRKNIATIAPQSPVLGGTWYVVRVSINPTDKNGSVVYEDGHIQETSKFAYQRKGAEVVIEWVK